MKIALLGMLGYHEETTVGPIVKALESKGVSVTRRLGGNCDFFTEAGRVQMGTLANHASCVNLAAYDALLFVDAWCPWLPLVLWNLGYQTCYAKNAVGKIRGRPHLIGMLHGCVGMIGDVAQAIPKASSYERFLGDAFDLVICQAEWQADLFPSYKTRACPWPYGKVQASRPSIPPTRRIVYAARWDRDKGCRTFVDLIRQAAAEDALDVEFVITDPKATLDVPEGRVRIVGWLDRDGMKALASEGGYVWAGAMSETAAEGVMEMVSYGLQPLQSHHVAYRHLPERTRWATPADAIAIVRSGVGMTIEEWDAWYLANQDNASKIADRIIAEIKES